MTTKQRLTAATKEAATRIRTAGRKTAKQLVAAADAALVRAGDAAKARQRQRAMKTALKTAGKAAVVAGTAAATILAARAAVRAARREKVTTP